MAPGDNGAFFSQRGEGQGAGAQLRDAFDRVSSIEGRRHVLQHHEIVTRTRADYIEAISQELLLNLLKCCCRAAVLFAGQPIEPCQCPSHWDDSRSERPSKRSGPQLPLSSCRKAAVSPPASSMPQVT